MIGIVCGTRQEAAVLTEFGRNQLISIAISAASADRAEARARDLVAAGATALMSAGVAGGLDPCLKPGDVVIAPNILSINGTWPTSYDQIDQPTLVNCHTGAVLGVDEPIVDRTTKSQLYIETGAAAVDMESHRVALIAKEHGIPFLVVRVIADPALQSVPPTALLGIDQNGNETIWPVLRGLLSRPTDLPALLRLAKDYKTALKSLSRFAQLAPSLDTLFGAHKVVAAS